MVESARLGEALLQADDHGLRVPGKIMRTSIYERFESSCQVRRAETAEKLRTVDLAVQDQLSGKVTERLTAKNLYSMPRLRLTEHEGRTLLDYVKDVNGKRSGE